VIYQLYLACTPRDSDNYQIFIGTNHRDAVPVPWNEARRALDPTDFNRMCRLSFTDWCTRNPELAP